MTCGPCADRERGQAERGQQRAGSRSDLVFGFDHGSLNRFQSASALRRYGLLPRTHSNGAHPVVTAHRFRRDGNSAGMSRRYRGRKEKGSELFTACRTFGRLAACHALYDRLMLGWFTTSSIEEIIANRCSLKTRTTALS